MRSHPSDVVQEFINQFSFLWLLKYLKLNQVKLILDSLKEETNIYIFPANGNTELPREEYYPPSHITEKSTRILCFVFKRLFKAFSLDYFLLQMLPPSNY